MREDYSADGSAWTSFPHDHARSRAYRWGEDGLAGFCDVEQRLCLGLALWNGRDPILRAVVKARAGIRAVGELALCSGYALCLPRSPFLSVRDRTVLVCSSDTATA